MIIDYVKLGDTLRHCFGTASPTTGAATNADSTPTVVVLQQGIAMSYVPVVTNIATGLYELAIVCSTANGFHEGREYSAYMTATVAGVSGRDGVASFVIRATPARLLGDTIRVCLGTADSTGEATNADTTPTVTVLEQGSALAYSPTVTNIAVGLYEAAIVCSVANGFEQNKEYTAYAAATVDGTTGRDGIASFLIRAAFPTAGNATTPESIRDRMIAVISALTPASDSGVPFRAYRNEGGADFQRWADLNPSGARRRFQVRTAGLTSAPAVSDTLVEEHQVEVTILVAYPQTGRDGNDQALDRDDTADADQFQIDRACGMLGKANFSSPHPDATWIEGVPGERVLGEVCDFVELRYVMIYKRAR